MEDNDDTVLEDLAAALKPAGLIYRGGFYPAPDDDVPPLPDGRPTGTVLLIGNAGDAMWDFFAAADPVRAGANPLDNWLRQVILETVPAAAHVVFPNDGPPFVPIQNWARRAEPVYRSPLGIMIHPDYGLWHVYRAALCFAEKIALPPRDARPSPCESCDAKPCLKVCPADAFTPDRFLAQDCADHVSGETGATCRDRGCMARRACPVGRDHTYPAPAQAFHTAAFLRAVKSRFGSQT